ncbi:MAG: hypothetical protein Q4A86_05540, partial [Clostridia bacterium]|nr:hypothetical protein [Clostridia bacterium]
SQAQYLYINAPKGHSVYTYSYPDKLHSNVRNMPFAYHGSTLIALAEENGYICGIYMSDQNEFCVAWVEGKHLCGYFPGEYILVSDPDPSKEYYCFMGQTKWSAMPFVGSGTKYSEVIYSDGMNRALDGIGIEYQVISRNGKPDVCGPRDVYINDGSGWEYVTSFDLESNNTPVRITIYFDQPTQVKAVATVPQSSAIEGFIFRQFIAEMIYAA